MDEIVSDNLHAIVPIGILHMLASVAVQTHVHKYEETRWFFVHCFMNAYIALITLPVIQAFLSNPQLLYNENTHLTSKIPICTTIWLHLYHVCFYKMRKDDAWHHVVFVPTIALPGYMYEWGAFGNFQLFFICGLPGCIIYAVLVWNRVNASSKYNEPIISAAANIGIRTPGVLLANGMLVHAVYSGRVNAPLVFVFIQVALSPFNAIYYARQSIQRVVRIASSGAATAR